MTNATKGITLALLDALFGLLAVFDIAMTEAQKGAIIAVVNLAALAYIGLTYKHSPKRIPDDKVQSGATR